MVHSGGKPLDVMAADAHPLDVVGPRSQEDIETFFCGSSAGLGISPDGVDMSQPQNSLGGLTRCRR